LIDLVRLKDEVPDALRSLVLRGDNPEKPSRRRHDKLAARGALVRLSAKLVASGKDPRRGGSSLSHLSPDGRACASARAHLLRPPCRRDELVRHRPSARPDFLRECGCPLDPAWNARPAGAPDRSQRA